MDVIVMFRATSVWTSTSGEMAVGRPTHLYRATHVLLGNKSSGAGLFFPSFIVYLLSIHPFVMTFFFPSDLDWSWFEPEFLVTSSVDTYIYIWDTRYVACLGAKVKISVCVCV